MLQDDELTILDVRKFKSTHKRKFNYEVNSFCIQCLPRIILSKVKFEKEEKEKKERRNYCLFKNCIELLQTPELSQLELRHR